MTSSLPIVVLVAQQAAVFSLLLVTAAGAGTLAAGAREGMALRSALGLALCGHALFFLAAIGQLRPAPLVAVAVVAIVGGALRFQGIERPAAWQLAAGVLAVVPLFLLTLYPPLAFDETLYHLPFVRAFAREGALQFLPNLRFPVFPQIHELLCVPPFLLGGDRATHLVALVEIIITAALLIDWGRRHEKYAGWLAAALFLGSPLVIHLATITYVDAALTLFVAAGFYALDRERFLLAGLFLGTSCGVKYQGGFFAVAALIIVLIRTAGRRRQAVKFVIACASAALPTTAWILLNTGNPVFPFFGTSLWVLPLSPALSWSDRTVGILRVPWDVTFARHRMDFQPPVTPLLIAIVFVIIAAAFRDARARCVSLLGAAYLIAFSFLPQDSRYLVPLLPLVCAVAAVSLAARWPRATALLAVLAVAPGVAYAGYRIAIMGIPPATAAERIEWLSRMAPAYPALLRAGTDRVYVCGGERLKDYAGGELLGDFAGPFSYERILGGTQASGATGIAARLRPIGVRYFLVVKRACEPIRANGGMTLVYEDGAAQLWRVQASAAR